MEQKEKTRRRDVRQNGVTAIKVFAPLFSKSGTFSRSSIGVSFCLAFSLRLWLQRKSGGGVCRRERERRKRREPFSGKGLPSAPFPRPRGNVHTAFPKALEQMEKTHHRNARQTGETAIKVFAPLFSKSGTFSRSPIGVSFCLAFSLRLWLQRKSGCGVCERERGNESGGNLFREKGFPPLRFRTHAETFTPPSPKLLNKEKMRRRDVRQNGVTAIKVFAPLFSKSGTFPSFSHRRFFLLSFFFAPLAPKKKRRGSLQERAGND